MTGTADYSTMSENHEILVLRNEYADYIYDWTFHVGDTVKFRWFDGIREQETEFRIAGEISDGIFEDDGGGKLFGKTGFFLLPEELMNQMMPSGFNFNSQLLVRMDDLSQEPALRKTMNDLLDTTPMVTMESFYDYYQDSEAMYQRTSLVIWGLCGFIMLFAVINLVNTLIATTLSRKHEFSVLRSVGMAKSSYGRQYSVKASCWLLEHLYHCPNWNCGRLWNCSLSELCWRRYLGVAFPSSTFCWIYDSGNFASCFNCCRSDPSFGEKVYCAAVERDRLSNRNILKWKQFTLKLLNIWVISATFGG